MIRKLKLNSAIRQLWFGSKIEYSKTLRWTLIILADCPLVIRTCFQHLLLVIGFSNPKITLAVLSANEILAIFFKLCFREKLPKKTNYAPLSLQILSSFLLVFFLTSVWISSCFIADESDGLSQDLQVTLIWLIVGIFFTEYLIAAILVYHSCFRLKKIYLDENDEEDKDGRQDFLIYRKLQKRKFRPKMALEEQEETIEALRG